MSGWRTQLKYDPVEPLLNSDNVAVIYFTYADLLQEGLGPTSLLWEHPENKQILRKQQPDGSWKYTGKRAAGTGIKYQLIETWKQLRFLVNQYGMDRSHPAIEKAAEFIFSCQTEEGDIRGILANQLAPYYTGAIMSLLIDAGYCDDPRIEKGFRWLLDMRQDDGGWVIGSPGIIGLGHLSAKELIDLTSNKKRETARAFDWKMPFSAAGTGMVLRAFAAHPWYRTSDEARIAANLLKSNFFKEDNWSSYHHPDNWLRFQYPFWWTNLVSALDTVSLIGIPKNDENVRRALQWLIGSQRENGLWDVSYSQIHKSPDNNKTQQSRLWITIAICRVLQRYYPG